MATAVTEVNLNKLFGVTHKDFIYEDDQCVVFDEERNPQAPVHFLVVPRKVLPRLTQATEPDEKLLGHMLLVAHNLAMKKGLKRASNGYHVIVDEDHRARKLKSIHVFGRALHHMVWPVGPGSRL